MRILVVDGPGRHPESYPRVLGGALHRRGHAVIVHPARDVADSWPGRHSFRRRAREVLSLHQPDVVHVVARETWMAEAFAGRGAPVVHTGEGRPARVDWCIVPTNAALNLAAGGVADPEFRVGRLPYAFEAAGEPSGPGDFALVAAPAWDGKARQAWKELAPALRGIPVREAGDARQARFVISLVSAPEAWPAGLGEAMSAGRPSIAFWGGAAQEFVLEGVTGFLSAPGDLRSVASQADVLWRNPGETAKLGAEALRHAAEHFDPDAHARMIQRWYLRAGGSRLQVARG